MFAVNTHIFKTPSGQIFLFNKKIDCELVSSRQSAWFKNPSEAHNPNIGHNMYMYNININPM